jgi:transcriptional regulator
VRTRWKDYILNGKASKHTNTLQMLLGIAASIPVPIRKGRRIVAICDFMFTIRNGNVDVYFAEGF